jgi:hypothetical protein
LTRAIASGAANADIRAPAQDVLTINYQDGSRIAGAKGMQHLPPNPKLNQAMLNAE